MIFSNALRFLVASAVLLPTVAAGVDAQGATKKDLRGGNDSHLKEALSQIRMLKEQVRKLERSLVTEEDGDGIEELDAVVVDGNNVRAQLCAAGEHLWEEDRCIGDVKPKSKGYPGTGHKHEIRDSFSHSHGISSHNHEVDIGHQHVFTPTCRTTCTTKCMEVTTGPFRDPIKTTEHNTAPLKTQYADANNCGKRRILQDGTEVDADCSRRLQEEGEDDTVIEEHCRCAYTDWASAEHTHYLGDDLEHDLNEAAEHLGKAADWAGGGSCNVMDSSDHADLPTPVP